MIGLEELLLGIEQLKERHSDGWRIQVTVKDRIDDLGACWLVVNHVSMNKGKYPNPLIGIGKKKYRLARIVKFIEGYEIGDGLTASHLCENEVDLDSYRCIRPDHIAIESLGDNLRRSKRKKSVGKGLAAHARTFITKDKLDARKRDENGRFAQ